MFIFKKIIKICKYLRWPTVVAIIIYIIFITIILKFNTPHNHSQHMKSCKTNNNSENSLVPDFDNKFHGIKGNLETDNHGTTINEKMTLKAAFDSANLNHDPFLSIQELGRYINKKIREHTDKAVKMNPIEFSKVDQSPKDGIVTWEEYHTFILRKHGLDEKYIKEHNEAKHVKLDRRAKEDMMRDKARWSEAAKSDPFSLTLDEFLAFQHPESSTSNLLGLVDDLLRLFDMDGDDRLTIDEFSDVTVDEDDEKYRKSIISKTVVERREEFMRLIDLNKDGKADRGELLSYVDPRHPRYALQEAVTLINITDTNKDGQLSLGEMWSNSKIFMTSKVIDTACSFHDEF